MRFPLLCGAFFGLLLASQPFGQTVIVARGDTVTTPGGSPIGTLDGIAAHAVTSNSSFTVHGVLATSSTATDEVLFRHDGLFLREGDPMPEPNPSGAIITGFGPIAQDATGRLSYLVEGGTTGFSDDYEALYFGNRQVLRTGTSAEVAGFGNGSVFTDIVTFQMARGQNSCSVRLLVRVDVTTPGGLFEALVEIESGCGVTPEVRSVLVVGQSLCTTPACTTMTGPIFDLADSSDGFAINQNGDVLAACSVFTAQGLQSAVALNGVVEACETCNLCGSPESWQSVTRELGLSDSGTRLISGLLSGDEALVLDACSVTQRTGDVPAGLSGPLSSLGRVQLAEDGVPFWFGTWADPDPNGGVAIFRDDTPLVRRGTTSIAGSVVMRIVDAPGSFRPTGPSGLVAFQGELADGTNGVFTVPTTPPVVSHGFQLVNGCSTANRASLSVSSGTARLGDVFFLSVDEAQASGAVPQLFFANRAITTPFDPISDCGATLVFGEVFMGLGGPNPVFGPVGAPWVPGNASQLALGAPIDALNLIGETWYVQAITFDVLSASSPAEPFRMTNGLAVTFGSP